MRFIALEKLINLHDGYRREFTIEYQRVLLLQHRGERYLVEARCPHLEHPLIKARLELGELTCPLHGYRFSLADGALLNQADDRSCRALKIWPVAYDGSDVGVDWEPRIS
jgi:nitrite reductase/ring-hydroxylating ferredoxin subunit